MKAFFWFMVLFGWQGSTALAQNGQDAFYVDPNLAQTVFAETRAEAHHSGRPWVVAAMAGVAGTNDLALESDLFRVAFDQTRAYLPVGSLSIGRQLWSYSQWNGEMTFHVGYSSYRDSITARSNDGVTVEDNMVLQVLPLGMRHSLSYVIEGWRFVQPQLLTELTQTWLHQSGTIDGIEAARWRTEAGLGVGLVVLPDQQSGFGGIVVSTIASREPTGNAARWTHLIGSRLVL